MSGRVDPRSSETLKTVTLLTWTARVWSVLSLCLLAALLLGEGPPPMPVQSLCFLFGVGSGLLLAWRWERFGGVLTATCLALFYAAEYSMTHSSLKGFAFPLVAGPCVFFAIGGVVRAKQGGRQARPSRTAYKVALSILSLGAEPGTADVLPKGILEATERLIISSGAARPGTARFARSRMAVRLHEAFDWMMPGQFEAFAHRKAFCELQVREGIASGASQVLVLGAGYDTLGWRLAPEFPKVSFFEADHPATARLKAKGIKAMGQPGNLRLIAEDLGWRRLADVLADFKDWDPTAASVIIAEGLLMYLSPEAVSDLFAQCGAATGAGSRMAFSHVGTRPDGRPDAGKWTGLVLWLLKAGGEPWLWSALPDQLPSYLEGSGWKVLPKLIEPVYHRGVEFFSVVKK